MLLQMDKALIRINHLLEVDIIRCDMRKRIFSIVVDIELVELLQRYLILDHDGAEDASRKIAAIGDEVYIRAETTLQL